MLKITPARLGLLVLLGLTVNDEVFPAIGPNYAEPITLEPPRDDGRPPMGSQTLTVDVNGDGLDDVVACGPESDINVFDVPIVIWLATPNGTMVEATEDMVVGGIPLTTGSWRQVLTADFNLDGRPDLFLDTHGAEPDCGDGTQDCWLGAPNALLLSREDGKLENVTDTHLPGPFSDFSHGSTLLDVNGDGAVDIFVNNLGGSSARFPEFPYLLLNDGQGRFTLAADLGDWNPHSESIVGLGDHFPEPGSEGELGVGPWSFALDADGDGDMDLSFARMRIGPWNGDQTNFENRILINDGHGRFDFLPVEAYTAAGCRASPYAPDPDACRHDDLPQTQKALVNDFNEDGLDDFLLVELTSEFPTIFTLSMQISNGDGTFRDETATRLPMPTSGEFAYDRTQLHDLDNDGHLDIFSSFTSANWDENREYIWLNDGEGHFRQLPSSWMPAALYFNTVLDVDGDGGTDFIDVGAGVELHKMIIPYGPDINGGNDDDRLIGGALDNVLRGFAGNDVLDGGLGSDWLMGGAGDDSLLGGKGDDAYSFILPDLVGAKNILDSSGKDRLVFRNFGPEQVTSVSNHDLGDLLIQFSGGGSLTIARHFSDSRYSIEFLKTEDCLYRISNTPGFTSGNLAELLGDCIIHMGGFESGLAPDPGHEDFCDIGDGIWAEEARDCTVENCLDGDHRYISWDGRTWCRALITSESEDWTVVVPPDVTTFDFWLDWGAWDMNDCGDGQSGISISACSLNEEIFRGGEEKHLTCDVTGVDLLPIIKQKDFCEYVIIGDPHFY